MKDAAELDREFGIENELGFAEMEGEPIAWIRNAACSATIARKGAQVLSWYPQGHAEVFWVSPIRPKHSEITIRGGVPICWPWFGPHPDDPTKPIHGFVCGRRWTVTGSSKLAQATELVLKTETTPADAVLWPYQAELTLRIIAGATLKLELTTRNTGTKAFDLTGALHSYLYVSDISQVEICGFEGLDYLDKLDAYARKRQTGPIIINGEVDRIYLGHSDRAVVRDFGLGRAIVISKSGSTSSVVWNPWEERAKTFGDIPEDGYRHFVCVETANAGDDVIHLEPGAEHTLMAEFQVATG